MLMSLSTRLKLCSEDRPVNRMVRWWETELQMSPAFCNGGWNLLQHPELSSVLDVEEEVEQEEEEEEGADSFHSAIFR